MTRRRSQVEVLLREMRSSVAPVDSPEAARNRRGRTISHLQSVQEKELVARKRLRFRRTAAAVVAALAALATGLVFYSGDRDRRVDQSASLSHPGATVRALDGRMTLVQGGKETQREPGIGIRLDVGDAIRTTECRAAPTMQSQAKLEVARSTNLSLGAPERPRAERLELALGRIDVDVPKLEGGRTLSIHTPHATVTVHGTRFSVVVAASAGGALQTTIDVSQGAVQVEHDGRTTELGSGNVWSSGSVSASSTEPVAHLNPHIDQTTSARAKSDPPSHSTSSSERRASTSDPDQGKKPRNASEFAPATTSTLAAENALMQRAMVAIRNGDDRTAIETLDRLLARYPHSILSENAQVERARARARLGPAHVEEP
jgi:hypothetical protein